MIRAWFRRWLGVEPIYELYDRLADDVEKYQRERRQDFDQLYRLMEAHVRLAERQSEVSLDWRSVLMARGEAVSASIAAIETRQDLQDQMIARLLSGTGMPMPTPRDGEEWQYDPEETLSDLAPEVDTGDDSLEAMMSWVKEATDGKPAEDVDGERAGSE